VQRGSEAEQRADVAGEGHGHGGDRTGGNHQQKGPGVEERRERPERLAEVGVPSADPWSPLAQLTEDEGANEGDDSTPDPDPKGGGGGADPLGHDGGIEEDADPICRR
jgi:hypothetical protein